MIKRIVLLSTLFIIFCLSNLSESNAVVLDFEDLWAPFYGQPVPNGYGGFNWNSATQVGFVDGPLHNPGSGYDYGSVSGNMVVYNWQGLSSTNIDWVGGDKFDFNGAYFTSAWYDQIIIIEGYNNGLQLYSSGTIFINPLTPLWVSLNWFGIDQLVIHNTNMQWVMDNFT